MITGVAVSCTERATSRCVTFSRSELCHGGHVDPLQEGGMQCVRCCKQVRSGIAFG